MGRFVYRNKKIFLLKFLGTSACIPKECCFEHTIAVIPGRHHRQWDYRLSHTALHEYAADQLGLRYLYRPLDTDALGPQKYRYTDTSPAPLLTWGLRLGYNAFNVTFPFKQSILPHLDEVTATAQRLESVNKNEHTVGHNTDVSSYRTALQAGLSPSPEDLHTVTQLGVGGAGSATADALITLGTQTLFLYDTDPARARSQAEELRNHYPAATIKALNPEDLREAIASSQGLVNAPPSACTTAQAPPAPRLTPRRGLGLRCYLPAAKD